MNIEEAIKTAIEYETRVREVYVEALDEATDPVGLKVFKMLADEENNHVAYLESKLRGWLFDGKLSASDLETTVPAAERIQAGVDKLDRQIEREDHGRELAMLEKAHQVELETSAFYGKMVAELDAAGREFFSRFVQIEEGHVALVAAEIDALAGKGFWFDMPEFDLENG